MEKDTKTENTDNVEKVSRKDSLIHRLEDKDFSSLKEDLETIIAKKIYNKVQEKKVEVLNTLNGVKKDKE